MADQVSLNLNVFMRSATQVRARARPAPLLYGDALRAKPRVWG